MVIRKLKCSKFELNETVLNNENEIDINVSDKGKYLIHRVVKTLLKNKSQKTSCTKTRSEITATGAKPWKQKGTGRARAGATSSPIWRGGGVTFGPRPRKIYLKINKKEKKLALQTLLYNNNNKMTIVKDFSLEDFKTKSFLKKFNFIDQNEKILIIFSKPNKNFLLSTQNLKNVVSTQINNLNLIDILKAKQIFIEEQAFLILGENSNEKH